MSADLEKILRSQQAGGTPATVKVLVALAQAKPSQALLGRLERLGLTVESAVGNKLTGSIPRDRLAALRRDSDVSEVEESVRLGPH
jgi:hypothetical protein